MRSLYKIFVAMKLIITNKLKITSTYCLRILTVRSLGICVNLTLAQGLIKFEIKVLVGMLSLWNLVSFLELIWILTEFCLSASSTQTLVLFLAVEDPRVYLKLLSMQSFSIFFTSNEVEFLLYSICFLRSSHGQFRPSQKIPFLLTHSQLIWYLNYISKILSCL